jgi:ABC-2 type transport system ATP-binding protein
MSLDPTIRICGLSVRFGRFVAVDCMDLDLGRGEVVGLVGPNGAGKSSTLRVLTGERGLSGGSVTVAGKDLVGDWNAIKPLIGYVPDRENHFEEFTGRKNLRFFAGLYSVPVDRVDACLRLVELADAAELRVRDYSLGMRRKLLVARAILHRPPILYLDEPTANMDAHSALVVRRIVREHADEGGTVLLTTHNMEEVEAVCDRVALLCRGRLVAVEGLKALQESGGLRSAFLTLTEPMTHN